MSRPLTKIIETETDYGRERVAMHAMDSSNVDRVGWSRASERLFVMFLGRPSAAHGVDGKLYVYEGVPHSLYLDLCTAESVGSFLAAKIIAKGYQANRFDYFILPPAFCWSEYEDEQFSGRFETREDAVRDAFHSDEWIDSLYTAEARPVELLAYFAEYLDIEDIMLRFFERLPEDSGFVRNPKLYEGLFDRPKLDDLRRRFMRAFGKWLTAHDLHEDDLFHLANMQSHPFPDEDEIDEFGDIGEQNAAAILAAMKTEEDKGDP